jgi:hypothetical protein
LAPRCFSSGLRPALLFGAQETHHKMMGFDAEFLARLKKHGMQFEP